MKKKEPHITYNDFFQMIYDAVDKGVLLDFYEWHIPKKLIPDILLVFELSAPPPHIFNLPIKWVDGDVLDLVVRQ